jgi:hypothetical protein
MTSGFRKRPPSPRTATAHRCRALLFNGFFGIFCSNLSLTRPR